MKRRVWVRFDGKGKVRPGNFTTKQPKDIDQWVECVPSSRTEWERGFFDGYICAVANILRTHDEPTVAKDVLREFGEVHIREVNPDDRDILRSVLRELETRRGQ